VIKSGNKEPSKSTSWNALETVLSHLKTETIPNVVSETATLISIIHERLLFNGSKKSYFVFKIIALQHYNLRLSNIFTDCGKAVNLRAQRKYQDRCAVRISKERAKSRPAFSGNVMVSQK